MKPIIQIQDFKGGMTLNEKLASKDQFHIGYGLDFYSRKGYLTVRPGFSRMQLSGSTDIGQPMQGMLYATGDGGFYFGADNGVIYEQTDTGTIALERTSSQTGAIRGLIEYKGFMYYPQNTTIGRYEFATTTYTDNWKTGLTNVNYHPMKISADNKLYIGDDRYVASWDGTTYTAQALDIQDDWEIQCLSDFGVNYLAIGANNVASSAQTSQGCKVILWSRANSTVWDDEITIPEKVIYAMFEKNGYLWIWAGSSTLSIYVIPIGGRSATKVFSFENDNPASYTVYTYPNAVDYKDGRIYFGVSCNSNTSTNTIPGVYSINANPSDLELNLDLDTVSTYTYSGIVDLKCLEVINFAGGAAGVLYVSADNGATENLIRETLMSEDPYTFSFGVYESVWFEAPPGKKITIAGFGLDMLRRTIGYATVSYKLDGDTSYTDVGGLYQTTGGVGFYKKIAREAYRIKLKITMAGTGATRMYVSRLYVRGSLQDDPRITY